MSHSDTGAEQRIAWCALRGKGPLTMNSQDARQAAPLEEIVVTGAASQKPQDKHIVAHRQHLNDGALSCLPDGHLAVCAWLLPSEGLRLRACCRHPIDERRSLQVIVM